MKPTLIVLAAGMGSRYGGLKQMDPLGPNGEAILDYSITDAIRAGFGKVVFVIRHSFGDDFKKMFSAEHFHNQIDVEYVFQELDYLPKGFTVPEGREKPWGTNHAVLMAKEVVHEPFAIINADDFYGREAFQTMADYLRGLEGKKGAMCMVGYKLANTLSDFGSVNRGVCKIDENQNLISVTECVGIERTPEGIAYSDAEGTHTLEPDTIVSMNLLGFTPDYFEKSEELFTKFLEARGKEMKSEHYVPLVVTDLINSGYATMRVLTSPAQWFGVTYKEDRPIVVAKFKELHDKGIY